MKLVKNGKIVSVVGAIEPMRKKRPGYTRSSMELAFVASIWTLALFLLWLVLH